MKKLFLISSPRSGTNYLIDYLNDKEFIKNIFMLHEPLHKKINQAEENINVIKDELIKTGTRINESFCCELLDLRNESKKKYFQEIIKYLKLVSSSNKLSYYGFKIFQSHIENNLRLDHIIDEADLLIILDRDIKEIVFSFCQAKRTNQWEIKNRTAKTDDLILNEDEIGTVIRFIEKRKTFFKNVNELISKKNKSALYIHYDDFETDGWQKVANFLGVKLEKEIPFSKLNYDYDIFLKNNPALMEELHDSCQEN
jgi:hypothetical protein